MLTFKKLLQTTVLVTSLMLISFYSSAQKLITFPAQKS